MLLWKHSSTGDLSLKEAYAFFSSSGQKLDWPKLIWNHAIPPSKSFMVWRLICNRISTDENLAICGFQLPSMCSLCSKSPESTVHLFLQCPFALSIWNWFSSVIRLNINLSSIKDVLSIASRGWNYQCQV
ncbi:glycerol-3-phosphate dehydrogenase, partial [Trifolium medium]|nr:glycerol-3-phosphate dehydrogenase [Trifolium medium]